MEDIRRQTLIVQLFALFPTTAYAQVLENTLRAARLIVDTETVKRLGHEAHKATLGQVHRWVQEMIQGSTQPGDSIVLLSWFHETLEGTLSSLGTLDLRVPEARRASKVVVVLDRDWPAVTKFAGVLPESSHFDIPYKGIRKDGVPDERPAMVLRLSDQPDFRMAVQLGAFLGTRRRESVMNMQAVGGIPASATDTAPEPFQLGVPSKPPRGEETTVSVATGLHPKIATPTPPAMPAVRGGKRPSQAAIEVAPLNGGKRSDPRCEDQERISTIPPGPGEGPPDVVLRPRSDATPTQPK